MKIWIHQSRIHDAQDIEHREKSIGSFWCHFMYPFCTLKQVFVKRLCYLLVRICFVNKNIKYWQSVALLSKPIARATLSFHMKYNSQRGGIYTIHRMLRLTHALTNFNMSRNVNVCVRMYRMMWIVLDTNEILQTYIESVSYKIEGWSYRTSFLYFF